MEHVNKNLDCRNYASLDVVKGICHVRKQIVLADGEVCNMFDILPKCKHCAHYTPAEEEYLGICTASPIKAMTYPDLCGVTCEWFSWKET